MPPTPSDRVRYNSKIDTWLVVLVGLTFGAALIRGVLAIRIDPSYGIMVLGTLGLALLIAFAFAYPCRYTLTEDHLLIQSGAIRMRINYADITDISKSSSILSAPALSLQRVRIDFAERHQLVSPMQRDRFMDELRQRVAASRKN